MTHSAFRLRWNVGHGAAASRHSDLALPSRRGFLAGSLACGALAALGCGTAGAATTPRAGAVRTLPRPTPGQRAWQECEVGVIYHYDMTSFREFTGSGHSRDMPVLPAETWNPTALDTDQWLAAAKAMGARYAILTATHESGFLQWQSALYPYGCRQSPWLGGKGDLVGAFVESCRKAGIRPGIYIGIRFNAYLGISGYVARPERTDAMPTGAYMRLCERLVTEICTRYGQLIELWFDGGVPTFAQGGPDLLPIVDRHQPDVVFYHNDDRRHHRHTPEKGVTLDPTWCTTADMTVRTGAGDPAGPVWSPQMALAPLRDHDWFFRPGREDRIQSLDALVRMYEQSVGLNANLILGITPDRRGLVPEADGQRMGELGEAVRRRFTVGDMKTRGEGVSVTLQLSGPTTLSRAVIMEEIEHGQRIRQFVLEAQTPDQRWHELRAGSSIGHKRIITFDPISAVALRLRCLNPAGSPLIRMLAALPESARV